MKKIFFTLLALAATMSMNAQIMKIMKGDEVVAVYGDIEADNIVFEELPSQHKGKATRTGNIQVTWYQLWENGPKFARYNVGAKYNSPQDNGGYYCWGGSIDCDPNENYKESAVLNLRGEDDTATKLWGSNWRMPTDDELLGLFTKCISEWTIVNGVYGWKFTGKGYYSGDSVFLPAAGYCTTIQNNPIVYDQNKDGCYWSSTVYISQTDNQAYRLYFNSYRYRVETAHRYYGYSIRPVLNEK